MFYKRKNFNLEYIYFQLVFPSIAVMIGVRDIKI